MIKSKVFITGISGFVGQNLKPYLADDFEISSISRESRSEGITYSEFFNKPLSCHAIIHLAGKAHDLKNISNNDEYFNVNYHLTKKIFDQFLKSNATIFIYISSVKAVADSLSDVLTEEFIPNPITAYGKSKYQAEEYLLNNMPTDKKVFILRPCMIHGPGNKGNLNLLYKMINKGVPYPLGAFNNLRSFLSVENFCFVIKKLLQNKEIPSGVYNIADDIPISIKTLINLISIAQNKKCKIYYISPKIINVVAKIGDYMHLPLTTERLQKLTESYVVSNKKIVAAISEPFPVSSEEGLLKTLVGQNI